MRGRGGKREGKGERGWTSCSSSLWSKRPGQPASDVAETKRKKEDTDVREGGRGGWKERGRERGKERGGGREGMDELFVLTVE